MSTLKRLSLSLALGVLTAIIFLVILYFWGRYYEVGILQYIFKGYQFILICLIPAIPVYYLVLGERKTKIPQTFLRKIFKIIGTAIVLMVVFLILIYLAAFLFGTWG